MWELSLEQHL